MPSPSLPPRLIVISAPSGAGKTTLCQRLLQDFPLLRLSISSTTRSPRGAEKDGTDYFFLTQAEFKKRIKAGHFAEWAEVHGNFYGTSREVVDKTFAQGCSVLLDIDVQGAKQLRAAYPSQAFLVFISPPSLQELEFRLRARGTDSDDSIRRRLDNAQKEIDEARLFDYTLVNDRLERAYEELARKVASALGVPMPELQPPGDGA